MRPKAVRKRGFEADFVYGPPQAFYSVGKAPQAGRLYVDRFGREREDTYVMNGSERELVMIDIWDVVAGRYYALSPTDKKVLWEDPIDSQIGRGGLSVILPGIMTFSLSRHALPERRGIGTKQIESLTCQGAIVEEGVQGYPSCVIECWYAKAIAYVVQVSATWTVSADNKVETTFQLSKFRLREPEPELFQVPYQLRKKL